MMTISPVGSVDYLLSGASREDYYLDNDAAGRWVGSGCVALGLSGDVTREQLSAAFGGMDYRTGERLTQGDPEKHRHGYDMTLSAPKSVSVVWALGDECTRGIIEEAQARAVQRTVQYIEAQAAYSRRGSGSSIHEKLPGLVIGAFDHHTSRAGDPQLHTHCFVANVAMREDGTTGTIEGKYLLEHMRAGGAIYRAELAAVLREAGVHTERDGDSFKIAGVPDDLCATFSKRAHEIDKALAAAGLETSQSPDGERIKLLTRPAKDHSEDLNERREHWRQEAAELGVQPEQINGFFSGNAPAPAQAPQIDIAEIRGLLTQQQSSFTERDIIRRIAEAGVGGMDADTVEATARHLLDSDPEFVRLGVDRGYVHWTTREMLDIERRADDLAIIMDAAQTHPVKPAAVEAAISSRTLSADQLEALRILTAPGRLTVVQGEAGTGKTYLLDAAREVWEASGYTVRGASVLGKAAEGLEHDAHIKSQTVHSLLADLDAGKTTLDVKTVLVIDEAGLLSTRQTEALLWHCNEAGAKLVPVGDMMQTQSVESGGMFARFVSRFEVALLDNIIRQKDARDRVMVKQFARGEAKSALEYLDTNGRLHINADRDRLMQSLAADWLAARDPARPGEAMMFAGTRAEARRLNDLARESLRERGELSNQEYEYGEQQFSVGDRIMFTRNDNVLRVRNGNLGTIIDARDGELTVRTDKGRVVTVRASEYEDVAYGYCATVHKTQGVTVDRSFVLLNEMMSSREWAYVAASRHRYDMHMYSDRPRGELELPLSKSGAKIAAIEILENGQTDRGPWHRLVDSMIGGIRKKMDEHAQRMDQAKAEREAAHAKATEWALGHKQEKRQEQRQEPHARMPEHVRVREYELEP